MPAKNYWDNTDKTIYIIEAISPSTWEEARQAFKEAYEEIEPVEHHVVIILDASSDPTPPSPKVMTEFRGILFSAPENVMGVILVGSNQLATKMINILGRVFGKVKLGAANTRAEADEQISLMLRN